MNDQDSAALHRIWRKWYRPTLDDLFKESESAGLWLTPSAAIEEMAQCFKSVLDRSDAGGSSQLKDNLLGRATFRFDDVAMTCEAHHYAVDLFYKYYFPRTPASTGKARRGAPPLPREYLDRILQLRRQGLNPAQIASRLGQPTDRMRHQVKIAERRLAAERIRRLKVAQSRGNITSELVSKPRFQARRRQQGSKSRMKNRK